jgi:tetratricopeptide (TPR) repeat protein
LRRSTIFIVIALIIGALLCVTWIGSGTVAVRESPGGTTEILQPGPHLRVPLYHRVYRYDATQTLIDEPVAIVTRDNAAFKLPCRLAVRVSPGDVMTFHKGRSGRDTRVYLEETARQAILAASRTFTSDEILAPGSGGRLAQRVSADLIAKGIADDGLTVGAPGPRVIYNAVADDLRRQFVASAHKLAEASLKQDPKEPLFVSAMGAVEEAEGKNDAAEASYLQALYLDPTAPEPMSRLFVMYQRSRDPEALGRLERLLVASLAKKKDSPMHHDWLGQVYMRTGRTDQAETAFQTAINLSPTTPEYHISMGSLRVEEKRYDDARAAYQEALKLKPDHPLALFNLGVVEAMQQHYDAAIADFEKAAKAGPPSVALLNAMAQAYEEKGDKARAAEALRRSLQQRPDQPDRVAALKRLEGSPKH